MMASTFVGLRGQLPSEISLPPSVAIPFGTFEEILQLTGNQETANQVELAIHDLPTAKAEAELRSLRETIMGVKLRLVS